MSATRYKRQHVDLFIYIMARERNRVINKKNPPGIWSVMDNNLPMQSIARKSNTAALDRTCLLWNEKPAAACEIEAHIEPKDLRRKRALLEPVERCKRQEEDQPHRELVDIGKK